MLRTYIFGTRHACIAWTVTGRWISRVSWAITESGVMRGIGF